jgi:predicted nucleic acid-binding protein
MSRIFWDTNLFIYLLEGSDAFAPRVVTLRERMLERNDQLYASTLTLGELLAKPAELGDEALARKYEDLITAGCVLLSFDRPAARKFATIRRDRRIKPPDAIQLACAACAEVDLFITNDGRLSDKVVPGIEFITSLDRAFL